MRSATACGWATSAACEESISTVCAPIRLDKKRSVAGGIGNKLTLQAIRRDAA